MGGLGFIGQLSFKFNGRIMQELTEGAGLMVAHQQMFAYLFLQISRMVGKRSKETLFREGR